MRCSAASSDDNLFHPLSQFRCQIKLREDHLPRLEIDPPCDRVRRRAHLFVDLLQHEVLVFTLLR